MTPVGLAESITGTLTLQSATFPPDAETTLTPAAAIIQETERADSLTITAPVLRVTYYEKEYVSPALPFTTSVQRSTQSRSFTITVATVAKASDGDQAGLIGFYPRDSATLRMTGATPTTGEASALSTIQGEGEWTTDTPEQFWYSQRVEGPHVRYATNGAVTYNGPGMLKISGLDVTIKGAQNQSAETWRTGFFQDDALTARRAWLILEADDVSLTVTGSAPVEAAAKAPATLAWDGVATFAAATGDLHAEGAIYTAKAETMTLEGAFSAILTPKSGEAATMQASGDLRKTSLAAVHVPVSPLQSVSGGWLWVAGLALLGGVAVATVLLHPRRDKVGLDAAVAQHVQQAREHDLAEEWDEALSHVRAARKLKPTDAGLAHWEATILCIKGETDAALAAYDEASLLLPDGAAAFEAAVCAARAGQLDQARAFAARAVTQNADFAAELRDDAGRADDPFAALRADPEFNRIIAAKPEE